MFPEANVLSRDVFLKSPAPGVGVNATTFYTRADGLDLVDVSFHISRSDTADVAYIRFSPDNGRTWSDPREMPTKGEHADGTLRLHPRGGFVDPATDRYVTVRTQGVLPTDSPLEGMRRWTLHYTVSDDGGRTVRHDRQIVCEDEGCDEDHPLPGVTVGKNCVMIGDHGCMPLRLDDGRILFPCQITPLGPDGEYHNPGGGHTYTDAAVLVAEWRGDHLVWRMGGRAVGDPERSTRGMIEPTLARLDDGRILMVMRGSNDKRPELPGYKWASLSDDDGMTWSAPEPWTWSNGDAFFSPSSMSALLPLDDGRVFWFGNISPDNPKGNGPRHPLVMAEVDRTAGRPIRSTARIVDDRRDGESPHLTLSNFQVRQDRETGDALVHLPRFFARDFRESGAPPDFTADAVLVRVRPE